MLFEPNAAIRVQETLLATDPRLTIAPDGRVRLQAVVANTVQVRAWLRSFGERVAVVAPTGLRAEFTATALALARRYAV